MELRITMNSLISRKYLAHVSAILVVLIWLVWSFFAVFHQGTWLDETNYILKSWWYFTGKVEPYSARDGTWYLPLYFYNLGLWQWIFGHDIIAARSNSFVLTLTNIFLILIFLRRFGVGVIAYAPVLLVFAVNEQNMFYFTSATPYALAITLQLLALQLAFFITPESSLLRRISSAVALSMILTMLYFHRINLIPMIGVVLCIVWFKAGYARWIYFGVFFTIFTTVWASLSFLWGDEFIYQSFRVPVLTNYLMQLGFLPEFYLNAFKYSVQMYYEKPNSLPDMLSRIAHPADIRDWFIYFHLPSIFAATFSFFISFFGNIKRRNLILFFVALFAANSLYNAVGGTLQCSICGQAYMNYSDFLSAIALGLALQSITEKVKAGKREYFSIVICLIFSVIVLIQFNLLTGRLALPTLQNRTVAYYAELKNIEEAFANQLPKIVNKFSTLKPNDQTEFGIIGTDLRVLYTLDLLEYSFPPVTNTLPWDYRRLITGVDTETLEKAQSELEALALWTDGTVDKWLAYSFEWILIERKPSQHHREWLIWRSDDPSVEYALSNCFVHAGNISVPGAQPEILLSVHHRTLKGNECVKPN